MEKSKNKRAMKTLHTCDINTDSISIRVIWENLISFLHHPSQWSCCFLWLLPRTFEFPNSFTFSLPFWNAPSHGRLHPDALSRTHTDSGGRWNPTEVSFNGFFCCSALGQNLPSCSPLFLFIQEVAQTGGNRSTVLSLNDPAYFYRKEQLFFSLCICF